MRVGCVSFVNIHLLNPTSDRPSMSPTDHHTHSQSTIEPGNLRYGQSVCAVSTASPFPVLLLVNVACLALPFHSYILSAPNLLRVGSKENVFVEAQEYTGGNIEVEIAVKDFPAKNREFFSKKVTLTAQNKFLALQDILVSPFSLFSNNTHFMKLESNAWI